MKKIIIALLFMGVISQSNAQGNLSTYASNSKFDFEFWQYTTYSNASGYLFIMNNFTDQAGTVTVELTNIGVVETFNVEPYSYNGFQVGFDYVTAGGHPYVANMKVKVTFTAGWTSKLAVKTSTWYVE